MEEKKTRGKTPTFREFWDYYDVKRNRLRAERAWNRLSAKDKKAAMEGIAAYREDCMAHGISMMYAQGYITNRRWEDELEQGAVAKMPADSESEKMDIW